MTSNWMRFKVFESYIEHQYVRSLMVYIFMALGCICVCVCGNNSMSSIIICFTFPYMVELSISHAVSYLELRNWVSTLTTVVGLVFRFLVWAYQQSNQWLNSFYFHYFEETFFWDLFHICGLIIKGIVVYEEKYLAISKFLDYA